MTTVHVKNISSQTSEKEVRDFFSFCGKISSISVNPSSEGTQSATVTFEKETAAKTALLLDSTQLGPAQVQVTSAESQTSPGGKPDTSTEATGKEDINDVAQEDKPRSRIIAEYLAQGYVVSDKAIERALQLDQQHGFSTKFTSALKNFDARFHATEKAQAVDAKYGVTERAAEAWRGMSSYFDKVLGTPTGQRLRTFYETGNKQVVDVHNEARHLADLKSSKSGSDSNVPQAVPGSNDRTKCNCAADTANCPCEPGKCACNDCGKNPEVKSSVGPEQAGLEQVPGSNKTKCNCAADAGKCPCEPGNCGCSSCPKNAEAR